jgi:hypothetical protein
MTTALRADTVHIALLADHEPGQADGQIHAVLVWTEGGDRHYELLVAPVPAPAPHVTETRPPCQLTFELDDSPGRLSSGGRTWRTWLLDSVPAELRHLPVSVAARALADRLAVQA